MKSESPISRLINHVVKLQFFTISFLIHLIIIFSLGTVVIVGTFSAPEEFQATAAQGFLTPTTEPLGPQAEQPNEFTEVTYTVSSAPPAAPGASLAAIAVTGTSSPATWTVTAASNLQTFGTIVQAPPTATGVGSAAGGGGRGGSESLAVAMSSSFGGKEVEIGLLGTLYDLKKRESGGDTELATTKIEQASGSGMTSDPKALIAKMGYNEEITKFVKHGMKETGLSKYFRAPVQLKSYQFYTPMMAAGEAMKAFEVGNQVQPRRWAAVYRGVIRPPSTGRFRFIGRADDILVVKIGPKIVLDGSIPIIDAKAREERVTLSGLEYTTGPWIALDRSQAYSIDVLFGESPGGEFYVQLFVEQEGKTFKGGPALFQTTKAELPKELAASREGLVFETLSQ